MSVYRELSWQAHLSREGKQFQQEGLNSSRRTYGSVLGASPTPLCARLCNYISMAMRQGGLASAVQEPCQTNPSGAATLITEPSIRHARVSSICAQDPPCQATLNGRCLDTVITTEHTKYIAQTTSLSELYHAEVKGNPEPRKNPPNRGN